LHAGGAELGDAHNVVAGPTSGSVEHCEINTADIAQNQIQSQDPDRRVRAGLFGPWSPSPSISPVERTAQFRSLAALAAAYFGSGHRLVSELRHAEIDADAAARALALLDKTPTLTRRRLIATFGAVTWPKREAPPR